MGAFDQSTSSPAVSPRNTFTDSKGREWELALSVGMMQRIRKEAEVDFRKIMSNERALADLLFGDPETFARVLWLMVEAQAEKVKVEPEDFAYAIDGATIERATAAIIGAIVDQFPRATAAITLKKRLPEVLAAMDAKLQKEIDSYVDKAIGDMTTK